MRVLFPALFLALQASLGLGFSPPPLFRPSRLSPSSVLLRSVVALPAYVPSRCARTSRPVAPLSFKWTPNLNEVLPLSLLPLCRRPAHLRPVSLRHCASNGPRGQPGPGCHTPGNCQEHGPAGVGDIAGAQPRRGAAGGDTGRVREPPARASLLLLRPGLITFAASEQTGNNVKRSKDVDLKVKARSWP